MFCKQCGTQLQEDSQFCGKCGESQNQSPNQEQPNQNQYNNAHPNTTGTPAKSKVTAGNLALLLGCGIHNFYLGHIKKGVIQLCFWVLGLIGALVAIGFMMAGSEAAGLIVVMIIFIIITVGVVSWSIADAIRIFAGVEKDGKGNPLV